MFVNMTYYFYTYFVFESHHIGHWFDVKIGLFLKTRFSPQLPLQSEDVAHQTWNSRSPTLWSFESLMVAIADLSLMSDIRRKLIILLILH